MRIPPSLHFVTAGLSLIVLTCGFMQAAPRFVMTMTPANVGLKDHGLCVGVDTASSSGVWWWEPSEDCTKKTSGLMQGWNATVGPAGSARDITFQFGTHANTTIDVRLTLRDDVFIDMAGAKVKTQRRADLKIPDRWGR
jgi:hypothetical protein